MVLEVANEVGVHVGVGRVADLEVGLVEDQGADQEEVLVVRVVVKAHADLAILEVSGMEEPLKIYTQNKGNLTHGRKNIASCNIKQHLIKGSGLQYQPTLYITGLLVLWFLNPLYKGYAYTMCTDIHACSH